MGPKRKIMLFHYILVHLTSFLGSRFTFFTCFDVNLGVERPRMMLTMLHQRWMILILLIIECDEQTKSKTNIKDYTGF